MTAITSEIERFNRLSATWWSSEGPMRPLHVVNALRLGYVVEQIAQHFGRESSSALKGLRILDVGCGGGLLSEHLARLGAQVVEHVNDVPAFVANAASSVAPGGLLVASTIDRTWKSWLFAIVGAEYVLRVLPRGTHQWSRFVRPTELAAEVARSGLQQRNRRGMRYLSLSHWASWCRDTRVNYIAIYTRETKPDGPAAMPEHNAADAAAGTAP